MSDELEGIWKELLRLNRGISGNLLAGPKQTTKDLFIKVVVTIKVRK